MSEPDVIPPIIILITDRQELQIQYANDQPAFRECTLAAFGMFRSWQILLRKSVAANREA
jgi:hypothetical protein